MLTRKVTLNVKSHLNTWVGAILTKEAAKYNADITLKKGTKEANLKSIMGLLLLQAQDQEQLILKADGTDEKTALANLAELIETKLQLINSSDKKEIDNIIEENFSPVSQLSLSEIATEIKTSTQKRMKKIKKQIRNNTDYLKELQAEKSR